MAAGLDILAAESGAIPEVLQGQGIQEWFEGRAGLSGRGHGVDLAATSTDPRQDVAGMMIDDQERAVRDTQGGQIV